MKSKEGAEAVAATMEPVALNEATKERKNEQEPTRSQCNSTM